MLYDRPVRILLQEALELMPDVFTRDEVDRWFDSQYPRVKHTTIQAHLTAGTVNDRNRVHYTMRVGDLVFKRSDGRYERYDQTKHGWFKNGISVMDPPASDLREVEPVPESPIEVQKPDVWARNILTELWGTQLGSQILTLEGGVTQRFDLVSEDGALVGLWADQDAELDPSARWLAISEGVWLLQHLESTASRFVLFTRDRRIPIAWLGQYRPLSHDVEFFFLDDRHVIDLKEVNQHG